MSQYAIFYFWQRRAHGCGFTDRQKNFFPHPGSDVLWNVWYLDVYKRQAIHQDTSSIAKSHRRIVRYDNQPADKLGKNRPRDLYAPGRHFLNIFNIFKIFNIFMYLMMLLSEFRFGVHILNAGYLSRSMASLLSSIFQSTHWVLHLIFSILFYFVVSHVPDSRI